MHNQLSIKTCLIHSIPSNNGIARLTVSLVTDPKRDSGVTSTLPLNSDQILTTWSPQHLWLCLCLLSYPLILLILCLLFLLVSLVKCLSILFTLLKNQLFVSLILWDITIDTTKSGGSWENIWNLIFWLSVSAVPGSALDPCWEFLGTLKQIETIQIDFLPLSHHQIPQILERGENIPSAAVLCRIQVLRLVRMQRPALIVFLKFFIHSFLFLRSCLLPYYFYEFYTLELSFSPSVPLCKFCFMFFSF
jgi:hypothetical protein